MEWAVEELELAPVGEEIDDALALRDRLEAKIAHAVAALDGSAQRADGQLPAQ